MLEEVTKLEEKEEQERRRLRYNKEGRVYYWKHRERILKYIKTKYHSDENVRQRKINYQKQYDENHKQKISDYHKAYNREKKVKASVIKATNFLTETVLY